MSCPYLTQVTMVFCRASPVRVYVPSDRVTTASRCEGDCYNGCPVFRETADAARGEARAFESETHPQSLPATQTPTKKGAGL